MLVEHYGGKDGPERRTTDEKVRTYHEPRNQVKDHASGFIQEYTYVVEGANIEDMIEARMRALMEETTEETTNDWIQRDPCRSRPNLV